MASHQTCHVDLSWHQVKKVLRPKIINNDIVTMKNNIDHLTYENNFFKHQINKLEDDVVMRDGEIDKLNITIITLRNQINALRLELGNIRIMYDNAKNHYNTTNSENKYLVDENKHLIEENKKLSNENTNNLNIAEKYKKADIQNGMLISKIAKLTKELDDEKKRITGLNIYNDELVKENKKLQEELENIKKQNVILTRQLENAIFSLVAQ